jgi:hypothetical protein
VHDNKADAVPCNAYDYRKNLSGREMPNFLVKIFSFFNGSAMRFLPDLGALVGYCQRLRILL